MKKKKTFKRVLYLAILCVVACSLTLSVYLLAGAANVGRDNEVSGNLWEELDQEVFWIRNKADLLRWAKDPHGGEFEGKIIALDADISFNEGKKASDWASAAPGEVWTPVSAFSGVFDGRGHTVSGLYHSNAAKDGVGFFANLEKGAVVRNLSVTNSYFKGNYHVGAIAGSCCSATFTNLYSDAIVEAATSNAGGIVGSVNADGSYKSNVLATSCWFDGSAKCGAMYASGIVGNQNHNHAVITDCLNTGAVTAGNNNAAGISSATYEGSLTATRCVNLGVCTRLTATTPEPGQAIGFTFGSTNAKGGNSYFADCFGKSSASALQPTDIRNGTVLDGTVTGLSDSFTAADLKALAGFWKMDGSLPVPAYFAQSGAAEIPAPEGEVLFTPTVAVKDVQAIAGGKVSVVLSLQGNRGISDMSLKLNYDCSLLTLLSVSDGGLLQGAQEVQIKNPVELIWSSDGNSEANGTLATLVFQVSDTMAADAETLVCVSYAEANNAALSKIALDTVDGKVSAAVAQKGDVNGDFAVDAKDASLLMQYLADPEGTILRGAADTNGDGNVDQADADLLAQYVAGKNVTFG